MNKVVPTALIGVLVSIMFAQAQTETSIDIGIFSENALAEWKKKSFKNETDYSPYSIL